VDGSRLDQPVDVVGAQRGHGGLAQLGAAGEAAEARVDGLLEGHEVALLVVGKERLLQLADRVVKVGKQHRGLVDQHGTQPRAGRAVPRDDVRGAADGQRAGVSEAVGRRASVLSRGDPAGAPRAPDGQAVVLRGGAVQLLQQIDNLLQMILLEVADHHLDVLGRKNLLRLEDALHHGAVVRRLESETAGEWSVSVCRAPARLRSTAQR